MKNFILNLSRKITDVWLSMFIVIQVAYFFLFWMIASTIAIYCHLKLKGINEEARECILIALLIFVIGSFVAITLTCATKNARRLKNALNELQETALIDPLTGLVRHHDFFKQEAHRMAYHSKRRANEFTFLLVGDMDGLKAINTAGGHLAGDEALLKLVNTINPEIREDDLFGRYGGDEFIFLITVSEPSEINIIIERIDVVCEKIDFFVNDIRMPLGISIGYTEMKAEASFEKAFKEADEMMYAIKNAKKTIL